MLLFFSRRIGLTDKGEEIPIAAGGRLTGRVGRTGVGLMTMQTQDCRPAPATTTPCCAAAATSCGNSDVGAIFLSRQSAGGISDRNRVAGVDANFRFVQAPQPQRVPRAVGTPGVDGGADGRQGLGRLERQLPAHAVFAPERRRQLPRRHRLHQAARRPQALRRFRRRSAPEWWRKLGIRELHPHTRYNIYTDQSNAKVTHTNHIAMAWFLERGGYLELQWNPRFERITVPFAIRPDQAFPVGQLRLERVRAGARDRSQPEGVRLGADHQRRFLERLAADDQVGVLFRPSYHLTFDVGAAAQRHRPAGADARLRHQSGQPRESATRSTRGHVPRYAGPVQHRPQAVLSANIRFDLIHRPLSDLFVVYNEQRLTDRRPDQHRPRPDREVHAHARVLGQWGRWGR